MKKIVLLLSLLLLISCKKESEESFGKTGSDSSKEKISGKELFENKGNCVACHKPDQKIIGPSLEEIAKIYKEQNGDIIDFLKNDAKPIVDPSQYEVMKTNFSITKAMSDDELKALEEYIYTFSK
jgi:cytochrome c